jgi:hypothetical protein
MINFKNDDIVPGAMLFHRELSNDMVVFSLIISVAPYQCSYFRIVCEDGKAKASLKSIKVNEGVASFFSGCYDQIVCSP